MVRKAVSVLLTVALSASMAQAAVGLGPYPSPPHQPPEQVRAVPFHAGIWRLAQAAIEPADSTVQLRLAHGMADGRLHAQKTVRTRALWALGFALAFFTVGCALPIAYYATGPAGLNDLEYQAIVRGKGGEYLSGFEAGFTEKSHSMRRRAVVLGGLVGVAVSVRLVVWPE